MISIPPLKSLTLAEINRLINQLNRHLSDIHKLAKKDEPVPINKGPKTVDNA